ncbi:hypothetical protein B0H11DRAFT_1163320 [Mycena galericulata]|nr:hypothetical protein B0H11DRAFT_1163320 [Mycena galericulata]
MPRDPTILETRIETMIGGLKPAITLLNELHDMFATPFVPAISSTALALITALQNVKKNKDECIQLMEQIHQVLYGIINLHLKSDNPASFPLATLNHLGKFTETMHKIHTYVQAQQDKNRIKFFFQQSEMSVLLKDCHVGIKHALDVFKIELGATTLTSIREIQTMADNMHKAVLELHTLHGFQSSSNSFVLLPAKPKIFHGRDSELAQVIQGLNQESPRIAILGPGGMGKTSLARAALHHPDITSKFQHRFFVPCDSAITSIDIAALIGAHIGLKPGKDLTKPVVKYLSGKPACLLILDNLETTWEPLTSRSGVEELLSLLTDIHDLALIITMRGAERPGRVRWTRPFLMPLKPLSADAARGMFMDIADDSCDMEEMDQLLRLTDNMPLAVDLIAHLVDYEGPSDVLNRWETERTSMLSAGQDHRSNLDASIKTSLSSPRMTRSPGAMDLLSLLSILPDGISDIDLLESNLPIQDVLGCKTVLLATSLAFSDKGQIKSLVPIREHMQYFHPVPASLAGPLRKYLHALLDHYHKYRGSLQAVNRVNQVILNLANLHQVLLYGFNPENPDLVDSLECAISLNSFSRVAGRGWVELMDRIPGLFPQPCDHKLEVQYITEVLNSHFHGSAANQQGLIDQGISHFEYFDDPVQESQFYHAAGSYSGDQENDLPKAIKFLERALTLAESTGDAQEQAQILSHLGIMKMRISQYSEAQTLAKKAQILAKLTINLYEEARALYVAALCCTELGDLKQSAILLSTGKELMRLCGMSGSSLNLQLMAQEAQVLMLKSEYEEARIIQLEISQSTSENQAIAHHGLALFRIAEIDVETGKQEVDVRKNLDKAEILFDSVGYRDGVKACEMVSAALHLRDREEILAKNIFQNCLQWFWMKDPEAQDFCLEKMGDVGQWSDTNFHWSSSFTVVYLSCASKFHQKLSLCKALCYLGDIFLVNGDETTAENLFIVALESFTFMDVHQSKATCMLRLGDLRKKHGDLAGAEKLWKEAHPLFERSSQAKDVAHVDARLTDLEREYEVKATQLIQTSVPPISLAHLAGAM